MSIRLLHLCSSAEQSQTLSRILEPTHSLYITGTLTDTRAVLTREHNWQLLLIDIQIIQQQGERHCQALIEKARSLNIQCAITGTSRIPTDQMLALRLGCLGDMPLPCIPPLVKAQVETWCTISRSLRLESQHKHELQQTQQAAILSLAHTLRLRDYSSGNHTLRCQHFVRALAEKLSQHPEFRQELADQQTIDLLSLGAALHDIGKAGISDSILQKPGSLSAEEYELMKQHTWYGYQALNDAEQLLSKPVRESTRQFIRFGKQITLSHHERWDGNGYPQALKGKQIPVAARLMAVADVYDAITSERTNQPEQSHQVAVETIQQGRARQFDPAIVDAFMTITELFASTNRALQARYPADEVQRQVDTNSLH